VKRQQEREHAAKEEPTARRRSRRERKPTKEKSRREKEGEAENTVRRNTPADSETVSRGVGAVTSRRMASQKNSQRKGNGAENSSLAPTALARLFGEDEDIIEIVSPA
jgi:hypothetical protein